MQMHKVFVTLVANNWRFNERALNLDSEGTFVEHRGANSLAMGHSALIKRDVDTYVFIPWNIFYVLLDFALWWSRTDEKWLQSVFDHYLEN